MTGGHRWRRDAARGGSAAAAVVRWAGLWALALGAFACGPGERLVSDEAGLIGADSAVRIEELSLEILRETAIELRTVTRPALAGRDAAGVAQELFEELAVGDRGGVNRGVLLLVAAAEQQVRMVVSYGLEEIYPDAFVGYVERQQMAPYFADGLIGEGIEATIELLAGRALSPGADVPELAASDGQAPAFRQGGAGAGRRVPLRDGGGSDRSELPGDERSRYGPQPTPELAWSRFLEIQRRRIKDPELGLYDEASQSLLRRRPNSDAGQDHLARLYGGRSAEIRVVEDRAAVVFLDDRDHLLAPWFFRRDAAGWRLDGGMYPDVIGYNHRNQWRFKTTDHPYAWAFEDFVVDRYGFARHDLAAASR